VGDVRRLALRRRRLAAGSLVAMGLAVALAYALARRPTAAVAGTEVGDRPIGDGIADEAWRLRRCRSVRRDHRRDRRALGKYVLDACRIADWRVRGFALGVAAHGIGTARAFQVNAEAGAFAGLAFGLHGALAAFAFPLVWAAIAR